MAKNSGMGREITLTSRKEGVDKISHPSHSHIYYGMFQNSNGSLQ